MKTPSLADAELHRAREKIRRGLLRASAALVVILFIIIALAVAAVIAAWRSDQHARAAREASRQTDEQRLRAERELWNSRLAEARAIRMSGEAGRRERALAVLREAARLSPALELRNEAVASLALTD